MTKQLLVLASSIFLLGCAESHSPPKINTPDVSPQLSQNSNVEFSCNRGVNLSVNFSTSTNEDNKNIAIINGYGNQRIILPIKTVASGFLYTNGKYTLRGKADQVTWTVGRMMPYQCSQNDNFHPKRDVK